MLRILPALFALLLWSPAFAEDFFLDSTDGAKRGFLWKPISDTKTNAKGQKVFVILFPNKGPAKRRWGDPYWFKRVQIFRGAVPLPKVTVSRHKHWHEDPSNPWRQVWRGNVRAKDLPKQIFVVAFDKKGNRYFYHISDPRNRHD